MSFDATTTWLRNSELVPSYPLVLKHISTSSTTCAGEESGVMTLRIMRPKFVSIRLAQTRQIGTAKPVESKMLPASPFSSLRWSVVVQLMLTT